MTYEPEELCERSLFSVSFTSTVAEFSELCRRAYALPEYRRYTVIDTLVQHAHFAIDDPRATAMIEESLDLYLAIQGQVRELVAEMVVQR